MRLSVVQWQQVTQAALVVCISLSVHGFAGIFSRWRDTEMTFLGSNSSRICRQC